METGDSTAGNSSKEDWEQILCTVLSVYRKTSERRESLRINIRMSTYNAYKCYEKHSIEQEGA